MTIEISPTKLHALRSNYDPQAVGATIVGAVTALHKPAGQDFVTFSKLANPINRIGIPTFSAREKELMLLSILAAREPGLELSIHVYLGLMEGLSLDDVCDVFRLAGVYTGVDNYVSGLYLLESVTGYLENVSRLDPASVLDGLAERFRAYGPNPSPKSLP